MDDRALLHEALISGRTRDAARAAGRLARAGAWDGVVAATLYLFGRALTRERDAAEAWLVVPLAALEVEAAPNDAGAWSRLMEALVEVGRAEEAARGLALAVDDGLIGLEPGLRLLVALYARREVALAWRVAEDLLSHFPDDARAWSAAGFFRLEVGAEEDAALACATALALTPDTPVALLTSSLILAGRQAVDSYLDAAARAGVPAEVIAGYRRLARRVAG